jgi:chlorophyllide a reductase subunit Z
LGCELDKVDATPSRLQRELRWTDGAQQILDELVAAEPILVRISAAKRLRDTAELAAQRAGATEVDATHLPRRPAARKEAQPA